VRRSFLSLILGLLLLAPALTAETIPVGAYRSRLVEIQTWLRSGDWVGARAGARDLLDDRVAYAGGAVESDASVLGPIARASHPGEADAAAPRLAQLLAGMSSIEAGETPEAAAGTDPKLLQSIRDQQAVAELPQGGRLPEVKDGGLFEILAGFFGTVANFFNDLLERLWDWFLSLFPQPGGGKPQGLDLQVVTALVVGLALVLAWVGWRVLRHRRRGPVLVPAGPAPLPPAADDDPLSRESNEWERYARELAEAGRYREAVRAWYHAVLVALYRTGTLHHRKGRTNWEYVSAIPPGTPWRSGFAEMTRHFEREWYGRDQSDTEALRESETMALSIRTALRESAAAREKIA
jgi:Domain of unknown function (DUF4129)